MDNDLAILRTNVSRHIGERQSLVREIDVLLLRLGRKESDEDYNRFYELTALHAQLVGQEPMFHGS